MIRTSLDWDACRCPDQMVRYPLKLGIFNAAKIRHGKHWSTTVRKLRLVVCALIRQDFLTLVQSKIVDAGELLADDQLDETTRQLLINRNPDQWGPSGAWTVLNDDIIESLGNLIITGDFTNTLSARIVQCRVIREIINPFAGPPAQDVHADWRLWRDGPVLRMAHDIYRGRDFDALPILADAMEEAGSNDKIMLQHLRADKVHYPGCWALDLLLGKR